MIDFINRNYAVYFEEFCQNVATELIGINLILCALFTTAECISDSKISIET